MDTLDADDLATWSGGRWTGPRPGPIAGVCLDTRVLQKGNLFIALRGDKADGHAYLPQAHTRGSSAALVQRGTPPCGLPLLEVEDPRRALAAMARGYRDTLAARFIAVTGSTGKTTVKEMIADALGRAAPTARTLGNWNNDIGLPLSLLSMGRSARYGVFELGMNHPGELDPLCAILRPHVGVVTSVGPVHIEHFDSEEAIAREKSAVLRALPVDGLAVLPADSPWFGLLREAVRSELCTVSLQGPADYRAHVEGAGRFRVREARTGEEHVFTAPLPGRYVIEDALFAVAVGRREGLGWDMLAEAIRAYRPLHLRWQEERRDGVLFINDAYNANPMSMRAALQAFAETPVLGRRWLVLAGMRELGSSARQAHRDLGRHVADGPWAGLIAVGAEGSLIAEGAAAAGWTKALAVADAAGAAAALRERVTEGDAVLLKASRGERLEDVLVEWDKARSPAG